MAHVLSLLERSILQWLLRAAKAYHKLAVTGLTSYARSVAVYSTVPDQSQAVLEADGAEGNRLQSRCRVLDLLKN